MKRKEFLKLSGFLLTFPAVFSRHLLSNGLKGDKLYDKVLVLGFDGMDPNITMSLVKLGKLPNIRKFLNSNGYLTQMMSTPPPASPVAWASFSTGKDPGAHGIFDFIHRDPETYVPKFSIATAKPPDKILKLGSYKIPLDSGEVILNRKGKPFWDYIQDSEIEATVFKIPSNYPPSEMRFGRALSGMGTPDMLGGYGTYTLYTTDEDEASKEYSGANVSYAYFDEKNSLEGEIEGPVTSLKEEADPAVANFKVYWDKTHKTARIDIQGKELYLKEGDFSRWIEIKFDVIPNIESVKAIVRFYLLNAGDKFRLYVSPPSIDPAAPAQPISSPESYGKELVKKAGLFHTLGLPADTKALSNQTFDFGNFLVQSMSVFDESKKIFNYELSRFLNIKRGMLFFYFSSLDQGSHMSWALRDKGHPFYKPKEAAEFGDQVEQLYLKFDEVVGKIINTVPKSIPIVILSDHGFNSFRRRVNLNRILYEGGFLKLNSSSPEFPVSILDDANWDETKAYAIGLNGLYLNMKGREGNGIVSKEERRGVLEDIKKLLLSYKDPENGTQAITKVFITEDIFAKDYLNLGPDIVVGFNHLYRVDNDSALGTFSKQAITDNMDWWAGDHCIDPHVVKATLMTNFKIDNKKNPVIWDLAPTILKLFGIQKPQDMRGKTLI